VEGNLFTVEELLDWTPPKQDWIIPDLLIPEGKMAVVGSKKSFKSMLISVDLAFRIAMGDRWLGLQTHKSRVFVLQVEIPQMALQTRVRKWIVGHGLPEPPPNLYYWTTRCKLDRNHDYQKVLSQLQKVQPDVLILDCLYRLMSGNVNDNSDMGRFLDHIELLQESVKGLAVILIHHKGKTLFTEEGIPIDRGTESSLGASTLNNWYDSHVGVERLSERELVRVSFEDLRLAPDDLVPLDLVYNKHTIDFSVLNEDLKVGTIEEE